MLNIKGIDATLPISITLFSDHLKQNSFQPYFIGPNRSEFSILTIYGTVFLKFYFETKLFVCPCPAKVQIIHLNLSAFCSFIDIAFQIIFLQVHGMHAMRVTNFPHLNHLKEIYLASISSNRCSASSRSKSKIKKPIRKMPKPRIFPRFCKCWNLKKKEKGKGKTVIRDTQTSCTIGPTTKGTILLDRGSLTLLSRFLRTSTSSPSWIFEFLVPVLIVIISVSVFVHGLRAW